MKVVVLGFNRQAPFARCLRSVEMAARRCAGEVSLVVSCDGGHSLDLSCIRGLADSVARIEVRDRLINLGLRRHMYMLFEECIAENEPYLILEDDLFLIKHAIEFVKMAVSQSECVEGIAQISLYNFEFNEVAGCPTYRPSTNSRCFLARQASSWGFAITPAMAKSFVSWRELGSTDWSRVPEFVRRWPETSWKKEFNQYLANSGRVVLCPYRSLAVNMGEMGLHKLTQNDYTYSAPSLAETIAVPNLETLDDLLLLDEYLEVEKYPGLEDLCLGGVDFGSVEFDIYGTKKPGGMKREYVLTTVPQKKTVAKIDFVANDPLLSIIAERTGFGLFLVCAAEYCASTEELSRARNKVRSLYWVSGARLLLDSVLVAAGSVFRRR